MGWADLFKNGSLRWIRELVNKIVYGGLGATRSNFNEQVVILVSTLIVVFILYKLVWLVWKTMKFIISCLEW